MSRHGNVHDMHLCMQSICLSVLHLICQGLFDVKLNSGCKAVLTATAACLCPQVHLDAALT